MNFDVHYVGNKSGDILRLQSCLHLGMVSKNLCFLLSLCGKFGKITENHCHASHFSLLGFIYLLGAQIIIIA